MSDSKRFCDAIDLWANAASTDLAGDDEATREWRKQFAEHWRQVRLAIRKSCLLDRDVEMLSALGVRALVRLAV